MTVSLQVELVSARLDLRAERIAALASTLSEAERRRAARFRFARERRRFVAARGRLRELLAARLDIAPEAVEIVYAALGKPAAARCRWHFNLSHCGELALYAFSRAGEVGIDVEAVYALPDADALAERFFSPRERAAYLAGAPHERPLGFFRCWTRKEAFAKALGGGLSVATAALDVSAAPRGWRLESFVPFPGFIAALASPA